jgi:Fic family protein
MIFKPSTLDPLEWKVLEQVETLKKELAYSITPRRWGGLLRRSTFARAVQGSNSIEGYNVTVDDAIAAVAGEEPLDPKTEAWFAVEGYQLAMTYVLQKAGDPYFSYSADLIQSLHFMMMSHDLTKNPGRWRPGSIFIRDDGTGEQVYAGPPLEMVPALIQELIDSLNDKADPTPAMVRAAMGHLNLVMIHPFSDGNGRMARCLQTLILARAGTSDPQFASIEEYLGRNTREYYDVLAETGGGAWQPERETRPWIRFCLTAHFRQATTLLRRSRQLQRIWDALEVETVKRALPERTILALADATVGLKVRNATYRSVADISDGAAARDLKALVDAGFLLPEGEKRGRYYMAAPVLRTIRENAAEPKRVPDPFKEGLDA